MTSLKGVPSMKLHRDIGASQKTAWFMLHRIREAWTSEREALFSGPVEADETYMGGRRKNMPKSKRQGLKGRGALGKAAVVGAKDRTTKRVSARAVESTDAPTLQGFVRERTEPGAKVFTDESRTYEGLGNDFDHEAIRPVYYALAVIRSWRNAATRQLVRVFARRWVECGAPERWIFPSPASGLGHILDLSQYYNRIGAARGTRFWYHGLRNAFITVAECELMLPPSLTKRLVNHAPPQDITQSYTADWTIAQLREPAQRSADRIEALMRWNDAEPAAQALPATAA